MTCSMSRGRPIAEPLTRSCGLAAKDGRAIVTRDLGFPLPASHSSPPGVVLLRLPSRMRRASIVRAVEQLLEAIDVHELQGMITVVEPGRIRRRRIGRR